MPAKYWEWGSRSEVFRNLSKYQEDEFGYLTPQLAATGKFPFITWCSWNTSSSWFLECSCFFYPLIELQNLTHTENTQEPFMSFTKQWLLLPACSRIYELHQYIDLVNLQCLARQFSSSYAHFIDFFNILSSKFSCSHKKTSLKFWR